MYLKINDLTPHTWYKVFARIRHPITRGVYSLNVSNETVCYFESLTPDKAVYIEVEL